MKKIQNPQSINQAKAGKIGVFSTMIASGPVIIQKRNNVLKTLLVKHGDKPVNQLKWKFPGGKLIKNSSLENNAIREAQEEIGVKTGIRSERAELGEEGEMEDVRKSDRQTEIKRESEVIRRELNA